jgi:hypothetical protein
MHTVLIAKDAQLGGVTRSQLMFREGANVQWFRKLKPALDFMANNEVSEVITLDKSIGRKLKKIQKVYRYRRYTTALSSY